MDDRKVQAPDHHSDGDDTSQMSAALIEYDLAMIDELAQELGQSWSLEETPLEVLERLREESANRGTASVQQRSP